MSQPQEPRCVRCGHFVRHHTRGQGGCDVIGCGCDPERATFLESLRIQEPQPGESRIASTQRLITEDRLRQEAQEPRTGAEMIAAERQRQIDAEDWTPEHDDEHYCEELARAAACYAVGSPGRFWCNWPWSTAWWKPGDDRVRALVKAGALIAAEIDRLQRKERHDG